MNGWLLLRGLVREQRHWAGFAERLHEQLGLPVRTLDLPGVGTERGRLAPWTIDGIVDDLRGRFDGVGQGWGLFAPSFGGMITLRWAERHPTDFERVAVCNTSARDLARPWQRFSPLAIGTALRGVVARDIEAREARTLALVSNTPTGRAMAPRFAGYAREWPITRSVLVRQLAAAARSKAPKSLSTPLLVIASDGDRLCSPIASRRLAARLNAPLRMHPSAGHDLPLDDPDWVIAALRAWGEGRAPS